MGLRFIAPMAAKEKEAGDIAITSGVSIEKAVSAADKKLSPLIADNLRPAKICRRLEDLDTEIHKGKISRIHAEELMERYGHLLANHPADDYAREGQRLLRLLEAAIANHAGDPKTAEQFVGQHLRCLFRPFEEPRLFYWQRTEGRQGEIDYLLESGGKVLPVEVKSGSEGSMKSLHQFMHDKKLSLAVRVDANNLSKSDLDLKTTTGQPVQYTLLSIPLYLAERIFELAKTL